MQTKKITDIKVVGNVRAEGDLTDLVSSIKHMGVLEPLWIDDEGGLIAGHRRLAAAKLAGLEEVPVRVMALSDADCTRTELQLTENIQRKNMTPLEEGTAFNTYVEETKCDPKDLADTLGKTTNYVLNRLALLKLSKEATAAFEKGDLEFGHARILSQLTKPQQKDSLEKIKDWGLTVQNFADMMRWKLYLNWDEIARHPAVVNKEQQNLFDSLGDELEVQNQNVETNIHREDAFKKDLAKYLEKQRNLLKERNMIVYASAAELKTDHPAAAELNTWDDEYKTAVPALPGSKTYAVVVDVTNWGDLTKDVYRLKPKQTVKKAKDKVPEKDPEAAAKQLALTKNERFNNRLKEFKRNWIDHRMFEKLEAKAQKVTKALIAWDYLKSEWSSKPHQMAKLKEHGLSFTHYGEHNAFLQKFSELKDQAQDDILSCLFAREVTELSGKEMKTAKELTGINEATFQVTEDFLKLYTKADLLELIPEYKLDIPEGKIAEMKAEFLKQLPKVHNPPKAFMRAKL